MSGSYSTEFDTTWCVLWDFFHQPMLMPVSKLPKMRPAYPSTLFRWTMLLWPTSWPRPASCWKKAASSTPPRTVQGVGLGDLPLMYTHWMAAMRMHMKAANFMTKKERSILKSPASTNCCRRARKSVTRPEGVCPTSFPTSRGLSRFSVPRGWNATKWSVTSRPAMPQSGSGPPGCSAANCDTSYTPSSITIQLSSRWLCFWTSSMV
mmetsp:Transcript_73080/g.206677  ORF Transcript_73080/g.206677 Transcript_73080/m.206677 type:complete len:207 (-) Transcript_73080:419-1039(-)